jgi:hypothetical protein
MLVDNSDIEKQIYKLKENINNTNRPKLDKDIINKNRIWSQKSQGYFRNIIYDINRYLRTIKQEHLLLSVSEDKKKKTNRIRKEERKKNNLEIKTEKIIKRKQPEKFPKYVRSIYNKIKEIKDETNDLIVKDNKSLKNISMNFSKTARPVIILNNKKERKVRPTSASTYYESKMFESNFNKASRNRKLKNKQWSFKSFREGSKIKLKEKKNIKINIKDLKYNNLNKIIDENEKKGNLLRLNDMYRVKMNREMKIYNPIGHLEDMKQIQIEDVNMRRNMNNINDKLKKRIEDRCGGFYFKHQYEKYISKIKKNRVNEYRLSESLRDIDKIKILSLRRKSYSTKNFFNRKVTFRKEEKKTDKEKMKEKKENLKNILDLLKNTLDIEPIHEYINDKVKFRNRIKSDLNEDRIKYFSQFEEISKKVEEINKDREDMTEVDNNLKNIIETRELLYKDLGHNSHFKY